MPLGIDVGVYLAKAREGLAGFGVQLTPELEAFLREVAATLPIQDAKSLASDLGWADYLERLTEAAKATPPAPAEPPEPEKPPETPKP